MEELLSDIISTDGILECEVEVIWFCDCNWDREGKDAYQTV